MGEVGLNGFSDDGEDAAGLLPADLDDCEDRLHKLASHAGRRPPIQAIGLVAGSETGGARRSATRFANRRKELQAASRPRTPWPARIGSRRLSGRGAHAPPDRRSDDEHTRVAGGFAPARQPSRPVGQIRAPNMVDIRCSGQTVEFTGVRPMSVLFDSRPAWLPLRAIFAISVWRRVECLG